MYRFEYYKYYRPSCAYAHGTFGSHSTAYKRWWTADMAGDLCLLSSVHVHLQTRGLAQRGACVTALTPRPPAVYRFSNVLCPSHQANAGMSWPGSRVWTGSSNGSHLVFCTSGRDYAQRCVLLCKVDRWIIRKNNV